jgi:hypothetical protein
MKQSRSIRIGHIGMPSFGQSQKAPTAGAERDPIGLFVYRMQSKHVFIKCSRKGKITHREFDLLDGQGIGC